MQNAKEIEDRYQLLCFRLSSIYMFYQWWNKFYCLFRRNLEQLALDKLVEVAYQKLMVIVISGFIQDDNYLFILCLRWIHKYLHLCCGFSEKRKKKKTLHLSVCFPCLFPMEWKWTFIIRLSIASAMPMQTIISSISLLNSFFEVIVVWFIMIIIFIIVYLALVCFGCKTNLNCCILRIS